MILLTASLCGFNTNKIDECASAAELSDTAFNYITLSQSGQIIDKSKLKTVKEGNDSYTYVVSNKPVTINFKPFNYNYKIK